MKIKKYNISLQKLILIFALFFTTIYTTNFAFSQSFFYVDKNNGNDSNPGTESLPFRTIQKCADIAQPGDTCLVRAGQYDEKVRTKRGGIATNETACVPITGNYPNFTVNTQNCDAKRITFKAVGNVTVNGFEISHPFITIDGFNITGSSTPYYGYITIYKNGNYCQIINNKIYDGLNRVYGIVLYNTGGETANYCTIKNNTLSNLNYIFMVTSGSRHLIENNIFEYQNSQDYIRLFGNNILFKRNIFWKGIAKPGTGNHPDFVQTFGLPNWESYNHVFEENWLEKLESQFSQLVSADGAINKPGATNLLYDNIHDITFRRNIIIDITNNANIVMPGVKFENNTFYKLATTLSGISVGGSLSRGDGTRATMVNNIFLEGGSSPNVINDNKGFYNVSGASFSTEVISIFVTNEPLENNPIAKEIARDLQIGYLDAGNYPTNKFRALKDSSKLILTQIYMPYQSQIYEAIKAASDNNRAVTTEDFSFLPANISKSGLISELKGGYINSNGQIQIKGQAVNNIEEFVIVDTYATYKNKLFEKFQQTKELDYLIKNTFYANYNYVAGSQAAGFPPKQTRDCDGTGNYKMFNFCEPNGINGGDPKFQNINNPLGPDGIPFTLDDGLKPLPNSPLCGKGANGTDIGAYSCDPAKVFVNESESTPQIQTYTLTITKTGSGNGTIISNPAGINCGNDCLGNYTQNTTITLTATPDEASNFVGWTGACTGTNNNCTITMNANKTVIANFSPKEVIGGEKIYTVKKDGTGNFTTIQECANVAKPNETCLVYPGEYNEYVQTVRDGISETQRIMFKANGNVKVKGFRIKNKYITIDGFDISKYGIGSSPAHITIEPNGDYCVIKNNNIHDGIQLLSNNFYFDGDTKTIRNPEGGFIGAGFEPGQKIYIASNINKWILNHDITRTIKSLTDTTITINDNETLYTEGPVFALIYATRLEKSGIEGITMVYSSQDGAPENCVITQNKISNLAGAALTIAGNNHLIERNIIEKMNGWFIITLYGSNNVFRYNHIKNSTRYPGFELPGQTAVHSEGQGSWDFVAPIIRSFGNPTLEGINNIFEYNFFENLDNEFANVNSTAIVYDNPKLSKRFILRNNVFVNIEMHGQFHRPETIIENNTFYKAAYKTSNPVFIISSTKSGSAESSVVKNNVFIETNQEYRGGSTGSYSIIDVNDYYANYNFVAGPAAENYPPVIGFIGKEPNGINGGDPKFQNINNPLGPDGIPFTLDDGLKPLPNSPLCGKGANGTDIGAYSCDPAKVFANIVTSDTVPPVRYSGSPSGVLSSNTTQVTLALNTNENAICKYSDIRGTDYDLMTKSFSFFGTTSHSTIITGLSSGKTYTYYVRCQDMSGNKNNDDFIISFSIASSNLPSNPPASSGAASSGAASGGARSGGYQSYPSYNILTNQTNQLDNQSDNQPPLPPTNVFVFKISSNVILFWFPAIDNKGVVGYKIYKCANLGCTPSTQVADVSNIYFLDTNVDDSSSYVYAISAYDAAGNESAKSSYLNVQASSKSIKSKSISKSSDTNQLVRKTSAKFNIGDVVKVNTNRLRVRFAPAGRLLGYHRRGDVGVIIDGPVFKNGYNWWKIDYSSYPDGWSAENWLIKR